MYVSSLNRILIGVGTLWVPIWIGGSILWLLAQTQIDRNLDEGLQGLRVLLAGYAVTSIISIGLIVFYVLHTLKNKSIDKDMRLVWIILFFVAGLLAQPIYYFLYVCGASDVSPDSRRATGRQV